MTDTFTTQDLIAELQQYQQAAAPRREGGVTCDEWAEKQGVSNTAARNHLKKFVAQGILEREWNLCPDGQRRYVYYRIESK